MWSEESTVVICDHLLEWNKISDFSDVHCLCVSVRGSENNGKCGMPDSGTEGEPIPCCPVAFNRSVALLRKFCHTDTNKIRVVTGHEGTLVHVENDEDKWIETEVGKRRSGIPELKANQGETADTNLKNS